MGSYVALWLGMIIAAAVNRDWASAYQAMKIAVITGMFVAMWRLALQLGWRRLVVAMSWAIGLVLVSLAVSKVWNPTGQVLIDGPREGSFLAVYGVLWKAGAFFLPVFLADAIETPRAWARSGLMVAACVFLVLIDGSRTGLLLLGATAVGFLAFLVWRGDWGLARRRFRWLGAALALLLLLQLLNTGANLGAGKLWAGGAAAGGASSGVSAAAVEPARVLEGALDRTFETRIGAGDPARVKLLRASLAQVSACLPLGCGFEAMGTDIGTGAWMVVHNAYLAALGDFGVLGLAGMLGFLMAAWLPIRNVLRRGAKDAQVCFTVAAAGSALAYGMALMLNTFTTEMSEWGYLILMLAFAWAPLENA
ncbi:hypothetical protein [Castellaniella sp.]|uniref:hypothetical protein n=1 Tax=Castellaniella sp. TaxID=1955812 RepID=UPI003C78F43E